MSEFVLLFGAVTGFSAFVESLVDNWMMLRKGKDGMNHVRTYLEQPDEGQILYNGIPARQFAKKIYRLFSVVFQEYFMMPVYLGENIALQRLEKLDEKKVWEALEKAGMKKVLEEKKITLDRFVTRYVTREGVDFSGGTKAAADACQSTLQRCTGTGFR